MANVWSSGLSQTFTRGIQDGPMITASMSGARRNGLIGTGADAPAEGGRRFAELFLQAVSGEREG
jgi:hypothetical protein